MASAEFRVYLASRVTLIVGMQMLSVAVGWHVYEITRRPLDLGFTGLALFLPAALLSLPAGQAADRFDRRGILLACQLVNALAGAALAAFAGQGGVLPIYATLVALGAARAFSGPAGQAMMPSLVPPEAFSRAVAFGSSAWQLAMILGPAAGGAVYGIRHQPRDVYLVASVLSLVAAALLTRVGKRPAQDASARRAVSARELFAGVRYVWAHKPLLGAMSLDLFAVLLGGAVALLPIFARDILHAGPSGLGVLRGAPAVGAATVALFLARRPLTRFAGPTMFAGVLVFGLCTVGFGLSRDFRLSLALLFVLGAADMTSVVVRQTLVQLGTPDAMRGRVSAVNLVFIGASNELGEFESGVTAAWLGPETAVVVGGVGTCVVVLLWVLLFPSLRRLDALGAPNRG